jgi:oligoribonuclease NrnB/cAMP/cGMP phosphodiesterase (DHH superfamily)
MSYNIIKYDYVIYHKKCPDGFTGFMLLKNENLIKDDAKIMPDVPSAYKSPQNIQGNVIIIDVAYKYNVLQDIIIKSKSVLLIDHHISTNDDNIKLKNKYPNKFKLIYNPKKCGATLVWELLYKDKIKPKFLEYIEDNDTGTWKLKNTKHFINGYIVNYDLQLSQENIVKYKTLFDDFDDNIVHKLIKYGKKYEEYKKFLINENSTKISKKKFPSKTIFDFQKKNLKIPIFEKIGEYNVGVYCGSGCPNINDLAQQILINNNDLHFVIAWTLNLNKKEYLLTFRSLNIDISNIAKLFNGGGHKFAASCTIKFDDFSIFDLFI